MRGAGFAKLHLDTSMGCAGEPAGLGRRSDGRARGAARGRGRERRGAKAARPVYIIGTEVPVPGGAHHALDRPRSDPARGGAAHRRGRIGAPFAAPGLTEAFARAIGVVVQPGVEFAIADVIAYEPERARDLAAALARLPHFVFEAHSTDYQPDAALARSVRRRVRHPEGRAVAHLRAARGALRPRRDRASARPASAKSGCRRPWRR